MAAEAKVLDPAWGKEVMECPCGVSGQIEPVSYANGVLTIRCCTCGWTLGVESGLGVLMYAHRATELDPDGELWKLSDEFDPDPEK